MTLKFILLDCFRLFHMLQKFKLT